jgi:hypothetical protein
MLLVVPFLAGAPQESSLPPPTEAPKLVLSKPPAEPVKVKVSFYLVSIGKFDIAAGNHTAEFYLTFRCPLKVACDMDFELVNGRVLSRELVRQKDRRRAYLVRAELADDFNLSEFPFDTHTLNIEIVHRKLHDRYLVFEAHDKRSGINPAVRIPGWRVSGWKTQVGFHLVDAIERTFSSYRFTVNIDRPVLAPVLKVFLPAFFIVFVATLALLLRGGSLTNRLGMGTAGLIAAVMFHLSSTSTLPPIPYLTRIDKLMFATYFLLLANIFTTILMLRATERQDSAAIERIYRWGAYGIPPLVVVVFALVLFRII